MRRLFTRAIAVVVAISAGAAPLSAQPIASRVDTTALSADGRAVYRTYMTYLAGKRGRLSTSANEPSPLWSAAEQKRWPVYDLALYYLLPDAVPEVISLRPVPGTGEYRIVTRFRSADVKKGEPPTWWTAMTVTVHAVREDQEWRLANALPRTTRAWRRDTVGPITYVFRANYPYQRARAERAVAFTDSIAKMFTVPRLAPLTYYLASTVDEVYAIMGLESDVMFGPTGGVAQPVNRQLFSGIPSLGEEYRHELAHLMLAPLVSERTSYLVSEGVATWLGGTSGLSYRASVKGLAGVLRARPALSLDSLVLRSYPSPQLYPAGAVLVDMVHAHGGVPAVRALFNAGSSRALQASLEKMFGRPWAVIATAWRERVLRL